MYGQAQSELITSQNWSLRYMYVLTCIEIGWIPAGQRISLATFEEDQTFWKQVKQLLS